MAPYVTRFYSHPRVNAPVQYAKDGSEAIVQCGGGTIVRKRVSNPLHKTGFRPEYSIKHNRNHPEIC